MAESKPLVQVKFGTSSLRGSASLLTREFVIRHISAFLEGPVAIESANCKPKNLWIGMDRRESSPRIVAATAAAAMGYGMIPVFCGVLPTPALAHLAFQKMEPAVMVTASHNPPSHNGLKFFTAEGELSKSQQDQLVARLANAPDHFPDVEFQTDHGEGAQSFVDRYASAYQRPPLSGLRIGVDLHSSAAGELLVEVLEKLGAQCVVLRRSDEFVSVDTENLSPSMRAAYIAWSQESNFDAIVSTDGDADRPLVTTAEGEPIHGDRLGLLVCSSLGIRAIAVPVTATTALESSKLFSEVQRTRIGSPHVLAALKEMDGHTGPRAGFEANGGFLLADPVITDDMKISPLATRDSFLPIVAALTQINRKGKSLDGLLAEFPNRFVASGSLLDTPAEKSEEVLQSLLLSGSNMRREIFTDVEVELADDIDGLRFLLTSGEYVHFRPSGNAPELRVYCESSNKSGAQARLDETIKRLRPFL